MFTVNATPAEMQRSLAFMNGPAPLSFTVEGVPFPQGFTQTQEGYRSADGSILCQFPFATYENASVAEWTPKFTCLGDADTPQIQNLAALDCVFPTDGPAKLYYARGTTAQIDDFALQTRELTQAFTLTSLGSRHFLPFFNLVTGSGGVVLALGFTEEWAAAFTPVEGGIRVRIAQPATDFHLHPGEWVRNIRVLTMFWQGDPTRSFNMLRNHLVRHVIPTDEKGEPYPPVCCNSWGGMKTENHLKYIQYLKDNGFRFDAYWMDAGWHGPDHETDEFQNCDFEDWAYHQGDWSVNRCAHPNGLRPIADAAKEAGMALLLWFGTYTCNRGIGWHKHHPEWAVNPDRAPHGVGLNPAETVHHFIDFNDPEARAYLTRDILTTLKESGATLYREDAHAMGAPDAPGRIGVSAMHAVQNLYDFWDTLRSEIPGLIVENCGGGGSRIDLETLSRSYVLWRSDYNCHPQADPIGAQVANHGLGHFVPLVGGKPPMVPGQTYSAHSGFYGGMGFGLFHPVGFTHDAAEHLWFRPDYPLEWHKRMLTQYQRVKPYLCGNFHPLTPCGTDTDSAVAYRFHRPDLGGGALFAFFRQDCRDLTLTLPFDEEPGTYRFENPETGETFIRTVPTSLTLTAPETPHSILLICQKL